MGETPEPARPYTVGLVRHYLPFELRRMAVVLLGRRQPGFSGPWPSRARALLEWLHLPGQGLVGRLEDPLPALGDALRLAGKALTGG